MPYDPYPYTWNAERIRLTLDPWSGLSHPAVDPWGGKSQWTYCGHTLFHCGTSVALQQPTGVSYFPLDRIESIEVLKRGRWWQVPIARHRRRIA